jgi:hypothetical protein
MENVLGTFEKGADPIAITKHIDDNLDISKL